MLTERGFKNQKSEMKICLKLTVCAFLLACMAPKAWAALGLAREAYGVWDRAGYNSVTNYPYTLGQCYVDGWDAIETSRTNFNWSALDAQLQFAYAQNQKFTVQIEPAGGPGTGDMPRWLTNSPSTLTRYSDGNFWFCYYLDTNYFQPYLKEMIDALAKHLRTEVDPKLAARVAWVRCDTGATGDETPYQTASGVPAQYAINDAGPEWRAYRETVFEYYRHAFQDGTNGPVIPLLFQDIEKVNHPLEWTWVTNHVLGGFGGKFGGQVRGHNLTGAQEVSDSYREYTVGGSLKIFARNEMDQTYQNMSMYNTNLPLCMYWTAVEQLHPGQSVWDISGGCLAPATNSGSYTFAFQFFNKWAAQVDPPTAGGGFCIFHDGLDAGDTTRFPTATYGAANTPARYSNICASNAMDGAREDDPYAATQGQVYQRKSQIGFNDSGRSDVPGNYERFITQLEPANSPGVWRIYGATNGVLTSISHPFDRFGRRFDHANGKDAMYFNIDDSLMTSPGQQLEISVVYRDKGTGQFALLYDAVTNSQKTAFTVTKGNTLTWKTNMVWVTDWVFAKRGPNGSDLVLANLGTEDTIFHSIELVKLADVNVGTYGKGAVTGRTDFTVYTNIMGRFMERQRLGLTVTPAAGWKFTGWSGDTNSLSGGDVGVTNTRPFFFPTNGSQLTANFAVSAGTNSQPLFSSDPINKGPATNGVIYAGTLAGDASDPGSKLLTFSRVSGPSWLSVSNNGVLSGTPASTNLGLNSWLVRITNGASGSDDAILLINVSDTNTGGSAILPKVMASVATGITTNGGTLNGNITDMGSAAIADRGFVYKMSSGVTISDNKIPATAIFTQPGTNTWICPAGLTNVQVECWGGGGAGGWASKNDTTNGTVGCGGGAGGAYAKKNSYSVTPGNTYYVNVGRGGVSVITDGATGPGGDSWFNSATTPSAAIIAKGGAGALSKRTSGSQTSNTSGSGATGTVAGSAGDVVYAGGSGGNGAIQNGGSGGGSGGTVSAGMNGTNATTTAGTQVLGAAAVTGGGPGGDGSIGTAAGFAPVNPPGGGGGGSRSASTSQTLNGGSGSAGQVVLTYGGSNPGAFTYQVSGLSLNTQYFYRAYASNSVGLALSSEISFYTLARVPVAPTLSTNAAYSPATTLTLQINSDGNPSYTGYAIQETNSGNYLQADNTLGGGEVWQAAADWKGVTNITGNVTNPVALVTGLTSGSTYAFQVKARNGNLVETAFGPAVTRATLLLPPSGPPVITSTWVSGSNLIISGTNSSGTAGGTYYVRASTTMALPMASWPRISTNTYGAGGAFSVTNPVNWGTPNNFYRLEQ